MNGLPDRINEGDWTSTDDLGAVHQPHRHGTRTVTPDEIRTTITAVVPHVRDSPGGINGGDWPTS